ncbi:MAG: LCP family protein [Peptostreptococcaceae bacterium]
MSKLKKVVITMIALIVSLTVISSGYIYYKLNSMYTPDSKSNDSIVKADESQGIRNILLIGLDGTSLENGNRSDSMMILTIDEKNKNLKLTSLARDTYVDIKGYSTEKLTHAYAYGGPELLIDTIRSNFNITIDKYVTVNFNSFIDIVDLIGGVEVNVKQNDIAMLNKYIDKCYAFDKNNDKGPVQHVSNSGTQTLKGYQALAFSRIRYQDSAYARDERQREVIAAAINKLQKTGLDKYIKVLDVVMGGIKTNINPKDMIDTGLDVLKIGTNDMRTLEFPVYKNPATLPGKGWVIQWDKESNLKELNDFIFENSTGK